MSDVNLTGDARAAEIERLRSTFAKTDFYLMHRKLVSPEKLHELLLEHLRWLVQMEKQGHLVLSGPRFDNAGTQLPGISMLRAQSWEDAYAVAISDPHVASGAVELHMERWRVTCGQISLSCDLSDQRVRLT
jgi:uncharacterized protein YciI